MDAQFGLTCSSVNLRAEPDIKSHVIEALNPQDRVEVLDNVGEMVKVQAVRWHPPVLGYALSSAIIVEQGACDVFPRVEIRPGLNIPAVPSSIPLATFRAWLDSGKESPWLPADYLNEIQSGEKPSVGGSIRQAITERSADWQAWNYDVQMQGREASATVDEWFVRISRGRPMWSIRTERIFAEPTEHCAAPAWVVPQDIVRWTGNVRFNDKEPKYKTWYEVELTKLDRQFRGWYKASLLEEFVVPDATTDVTILENRQTVFDLTRPRLRIPADPEIDAARKAGRTGAQYIEINKAIGSMAVKHNLCGEFCAAALGGSDVLPFLTQWMASYKSATSILKNDFGTSIADLQAMLDVLGKKYEFFRAEASVAPITPSYMRRMLDTGRMAIVGTGITYNGVVKWNSRIRHWIVIEDVLKVGNSGWVRIYNPFTNCEEVYPFDTVFDTYSRSAIGLWVDPSLPLP